MEKSNKKISNPQFMEKAPKDIIGKESEKFEQSGNALKILFDQLEKMQEIKKWCEFLIMLKPLSTLTIAWYSGLNQAL